MSESFCQDSLENWFGRQRFVGSRKDNPSMVDFDITIMLLETKNISNQLLLVMLLIVAELP